MRPALGLLDPADLLTKCRLRVIALPMRTPLAQLLSTQLQTICKPRLNGGLQQLLPFGSLYLMCCDDFV